MSESSYDKLHEIIDQAELLFDLTAMKGWKILEEALKKRVELATRELINTPPDNHMRIMELQHFIKLYSQDFIPALVEGIKRDAEHAFDELKARGDLRIPR